MERNEAIEMARLDLSRSLQQKEGSVERTQKTSGGAEPWHGIKARPLPDYQIFWHFLWSHDGQKHVYFRMNSKIVHVINIIPLYVIEFSILHLVIIHIIYIRWFLFWTGQSDGKIPKSGDFMLWHGAATAWEPPGGDSVSEAYNRWSSPDFIELSHDVSFFILHQTNSTPYIPFVRNTIICSSRSIN